jgi:phospholipid/cholesterol/gamma-HCH transport system substrate-binding protein
MKRAQRIRLGIFILIGSILLLILVGFFTARRLFEQKDYYYVAYQDVSVSGLEVGSPVKFLGINVGSISEIYIDPSDVNTIIVRLSLRKDTPVKTDAVADIVAMGITGLKTIEIRGGSQDTPFLKEDAYITPGTSMVEDITGKAEVIAFKVEQVLNNLAEFTEPANMEKVTGAIGSISELSDNAALAFQILQELLEENRADLRSTMANARDMSMRFDQTSTELLAAAERVNQIMQGDTIGQVLGNIRDISLTLSETNLGELIENLAVATLQTQNILVQISGDIDRGSETLTENLMLLQHTLENLNEASRKINANPSILLRGQGQRGTPDQLLKTN